MGRKLQDARIEQQRLLAIQARAAYQSGREEYLKLLLNQEHPEKFSRTLTYYDYINKARLEQLASFNETLRQLANVEQDISAQKAEQLSKQGEDGARRWQRPARSASKPGQAEQRLPRTRPEAQVPPTGPGRAWPRYCGPSRKPWPARPAKPPPRRSASASARWPPNASVRASSRPPRTSHQPAARTCAGPAGLKHWRGLRRRPVGPASCRGR